jgi:cytochrome c biogenesis protein CcmG/thiol:disulfide interchange protein DsbE
MDGTAAPERKNEMATPDELTEEPQFMGPSEGDGTSTFGGRAKGMIVAAVVLVAVIMVGWVAMGAMGTGALGQDPFGRAAPDFTLPKLNGKGDVSISDFKGKPVVLNFWASWCDPCKQEAPTLAAAQQQWKDAGVVFLGVDTEDTRDEARVFEGQYGITWESAFDPQGQLADQYAVLGYPETFFIDAKGKIRAKYVGPIPSEDLNAYIAQIVAG